MAEDQVGREAVDAGRHGRVRGEDVRGHHVLAGFVKGVAGGVDVRANALQREEGAVAFVHVENVGRKAHGAQRADAADAEDDFLADARVTADAIKTRGQTTIVGAVGGQIGVEQIQRHAADVGTPDLADDAGAPVDFHLNGQSVFADDWFDRQVGKVVIGEFFLLPPVGRQALLEIAVAIQQADRDQRQGQIAGGFEVIAGQHAQAAGINRQRLVHAELGREVRDGAARH